MLIKRDGKEKSMNGGSYMKKLVKNEQNKFNFKTDDLGLAQGQEKLSEANKDKDPKMAASVCLPPGWTGDLELAAERETSTVQVWPKP